MNSKKQTASPETMFAIINDEIHGPINENGIKALVAMAPFYKNEILIYRLGSQQLEPARQLFPDLYQPKWG